MTLELTVVENGPKIWFVQFYLYIFYSLIKLPSIRAARWAALCESNEEEKPGHERTVTVCQPYFPLFTLIYSLGYYVLYLFIYFISFYCYLLYIYSSSLNSVLVSLTQSRFAQFPLFLKHNDNRSDNGEEKRNWDVCWWHAAVNRGVGVSPDALSLYQNNKWLSDYSLWFPTFLLNRNESDFRNNYTLLLWAVVMCLYGLCVLIT